MDKQIQRSRGITTRLRNLIALVSPGILVAVLSTLAALMLATAMLELRSSRKELRDLMVQQGHTVLETLVVASTNALRANDELDSEVRQRLLDNASSIRQLYEEGRASNQALTEWAETHNLHRVRIETSDGTWLFSNHARISEHDSLTVARPDLSPIFTGKRDTLLIGLREARFESGFRYALALAASDRAAIVVNLNADDMVDFRQQVGFGPLLKNIALDSGIDYIAVQDTTGVLAAAGESNRLNAIGDDPFLTAVSTDTSYQAADRSYGSGSEEVLEVVQPFFYRGEPVGLFRLGLSLHPLRVMEARIRRRILLMALSFFAIGVVTLVSIVARQNANLLSKQKLAIETYSGKVIDHVGDGIVVIDNEDIIQTINEAALKLLDLESSEVVGRPFGDVLPGESCAAFLSSKAVRDQVECELGGAVRSVQIAKSRFLDENGLENTILILRDQTRLLQLETQKRTSERMEAMGAMASGLAHEIRNPLNAVGTIIQQLRTDFVPDNDAEEYRELTSIVYSEVRRINESVQDFLRTIRPEPSRPKPFVLGALLSQVRQEYSAMAMERKINIEVEPWPAEGRETDIDVQWDRNQIQQVLMNLIQNSIDSIERGGTIRIGASESGTDRIDLFVQDDGQGIPDDVKSRIFDLYYTTKASGTGVGLSLAHRIVQEHRGTIVVGSADGRGTRITINLPRYV